MDFDNKITPYGDPVYDDAKTMHSVIGLYDFIISGFYRCEIKDYDITFTIDCPARIKEIQQRYLDSFDDTKGMESVYAIMIHLFFSMLPLHSDDTRRQDALLANAFRLYLKLKNGEYL